MRLDNSFLKQKIPMNRSSFDKILTAYYTILHHPIARPGSPFTRGETSFGPSLSTKILTSRLWLVGIIPLSLPAPQRAAPWQG